MKKMPDALLIVIKLHTNHERENNDFRLIDNLKNILKRRAAAESAQLKFIYDED
jgi:hypothetical protein